MAPANFIHYDPKREEVDAAFVAQRRYFGQYW
jgi:hypothetical protein